MGWAVALAVVAEESAAPVPRAEWAALVAQVPEALAAPIPAELEVRRARSGAEEPAA